MNEINPKYENTRKIYWLLTNQNPGFLYKGVIKSINNITTYFHKYKPSGKHLL